MLADSLHSAGPLIAQRTGHFSIDTGSFTAEAPRPPTSAVQDYGRPVTFARSSGFLYSGSAPLAVLMLGPIGYEELCIRTTWRSLAESLSAAGMACLRFDYPGVGDALDPLEPTAGLDDWHETISAAAALLRRESGCERLVLVGQGIGGTLATLLARALAPVEGIVLMAPVSNGARYLRELSAWAQILTERIGITRDPDDTSGCAVAGFAMPPERLAAIKALNLLKQAEVPAGPVLLVDRLQHATDDALAEHLAQGGTALSRIEYFGFGNLMTDPTQAAVPDDTIAGIVDWVAALAPRGAAHPAAVPVATEAAEPLRGEGFSEQPFRFGPDGRMFGVLCRPDGAPGGPAVIFVNAGRDYHIGWAGMIVGQARALARCGIASLRFDAGGIGDSHAAPGAPQEVLYSESQIADVRTAINEMQAQGFARLTLIGRCSGAYAALHAAVAEPGVERLVMINAERFVWDPDERIEDALRYAHRSLGDFGATLWKGDGIKRLLTGRLDVVAAGRYIVYRLVSKLGRKLSPLLGGLTKHGRLHREVHRLMRTLAARGTRMALVFSEGDIGLAEFHTYFGPTGRKLAAYPQASLTMVDDADHNFTHLGARQRLLAALRQVLGV